MQNHPGRRQSAAAARDGRGQAPQEESRIGSSERKSARRVLLLARGGALDGSQRQLGCLVAGLDRSRFEPVVVLDRPGPLADLLAGSGVVVHVVHMRPWRSFPIGLLRHFSAQRIVQIARGHRVSLVHASDISRSGYLHVVADKLHVPSVVHVRGPVSPRDIVKHQLARAGSVIAIARRYRECLMAAGLAPQRVELIDDAVDLARFAPDPEQADDLRRQVHADGQVLVGLVGRIEPFKRVIEFLDVIAPLAAQAGRRAVYVVIGRVKDPAYHQAVMKRAGELGLEVRGSAGSAGSTGGKVVFLGHCSQIAQAIAGLDILVTLSGGSVMFEAMAAAKCVLSVRTDEHHSDHTRHDQTAWCVTADQPGPATAALARLIDDSPLRHRLGQAARGWVEENLSPATLVAKTQAVYERLVEGADSKPRRSTL